MKNHAALIAIAVLALAADADAARFFFMNIDVLVNEDGSARVTEKYTFTFTTSLDASTFTEDVLSSGTTIFELKNYSPEITPHVYFPGQEDSLQDQSRSAKVLSDAGLIGVVEISYTVPSLAVRTVGEFGEETWNTREGIIQLEVERGAIALEPFQEIRITAPERTTVKDAPYATSVTENSATWKGPLVLSKNITASYGFKRVPVPSTLLDFRFPQVDNNSKVVVLAALMLFSVAFAAKRKKIHSAIRGYLMGHSSAKRPYYDEPREVNL